MQLIFFNESTAALIRGGWGGWRVYYVHAFSVGIAHTWMSILYFVANSNPVVSDVSTL